MADKTIGELPGVTSLDSDSLFVAQQQGVASKVTGAQLTQFANVETAAQVAAAQAAAEAAKRSETEAESSKQAAQTAAEQYPYIGENGHWYVFSASTGQFVDSGVAAQGPAGPTGPAGGVNSFNGRTGAVMPAAGDYTAAMVGAAPGGFGWGDSIGMIRAQIADESYETYCAKVEAILATMPDNTAKLVGAYPPMLSGNATNTVSVLYKGDNNYAGLFNLGSLDVALSGWRMIKLRYPSPSYDPVWMPFEWVNPPMTPGVEYRTVERWNGSPVYVKCVYCGQMADGAEIEHGIKNINHVIRYEGMRGGIAMPQIYNHSLTDVWTAYVACADRTKILLAAGTSAAGGNTHVTMWYTKTGE